MSPPSQMLSGISPLHPSTSPLPNDLQQITVRMEDPSRSTASSAPRGTLSLSSFEEVEDTDITGNARSDNNEDIGNPGSLRLSDSLRDQGDIRTTPAQMKIMSSSIDLDGFSWPCRGTRQRLESTPEESQMRLQTLAGAVRTILECIGEDPEREGLRDTPERYAKAMLYFTEGYEQKIRDLINGAVFSEDHDELVIVKNIDIFSLCEHHMVPFTGHIHIGYIPDHRVLGLSKIARLAEMLSRRLQVQERLTKQVALVISEVLKPRGVGVVMESSHLCMAMRGVQKVGSTTTTSCMLGCMRSSTKTREEFLALLCPQ